LENENLDPEGEVYFVGVGDSSDPPAPPLLNETVDLDGDVYDILVAGVMHISSAGLTEASYNTLLLDRRTLPHIAFS
jgi:hypothetical protein